MVNGSVTLEESPSSSSSSSPRNRRRSSRLFDDKRIEQRRRSTTPKQQQSSELLLSSEYEPFPQRQSIHRESSSATQLISNCTGNGNVTTTRSNDQYDDDSTTTNTSSTSPSSSSVLHTKLHHFVPPPPPPPPPRRCVLSNDSTATATPQIVMQQYYRIVYRGVVALVASPEETAPKTGSYLSYGEVFAGTTTTCSSKKNGGSTVAIRVETVLTGGYALDATSTTSTENEESTIDTKTPKRSNTESSTTPKIAGYILLNDNNIDSTGASPIVERLMNGNDVIPTAETGTFHYKIVSTTPVPILTGPCHDAPKTKAVVLPGTVQEISLRIRISDVWFLRLRHRRGWIADRKVVLQNSQKTGATMIPVVKEIFESSSTCGDSVDSGSVLSIATSKCSSSRQSTYRHHHGRRRRPPRRADDLDSAVLPRQIGGGNTNKIKSEGERTTTNVPPPSSNISILSEDDSSLDQTATTNTATRHTSTTTTALPTSPDNSFSTNKTNLSSVSNAQQQQSAPSANNFYLIRVTAPRGLKILDAPQFQVNHLIRNTTTTSNSSSTNGKVSLHLSKPDSSMKSQQQQHSIFQTMSGRLTTTGAALAGNNPAVFDVTTKSRILPRNALFEASKRMEKTASYSQGAGLIQLADKTGWAIVPRQDELDRQYRNFSVGGGRGAANNVKEGEATRAFEEVGSAVVMEPSNSSSSSGNNNVSTEHMDSSPTMPQSTWLRVMARSGVTVSCPPPPSEPDSDNDTSPTLSSRGSSAITGSNTNNNVPAMTGNDSDVASSVGSGFLDAMMFRTPKKKDGDAVQEPRPNPDKLLQNTSSSNTIPCGMFLEVEKWADSETSSPTEKVSKEYARLRGGQGWVPLFVAGGKPTTARVLRPEFRFGSFWFRVQSSRGIKVRLGPSKRAPSIKSEDGVYFRFECGEFLRASEVLTIFSDSGEPVESFAKLYRNRHVRMQAEHDEFRSLASLTTQAEWVQVYYEDELFLEECAAEPRIERHKQGWRYNVVPDDGVAVRKGPSFAAEKTGIVLFGGESVVINERVVPAGEKITWLRVKDGQGWIHDVDDTGEHTMIAHSLRHRSNRPHKPAIPREGNEIAYNTIIARLFHNDGPDSNNNYRPTRDLGSIRR